MVKNAWVGNAFEIGLGSGWSDTLVGRKWEVFRRPVLPFLCSFSIIHAISLARISCLASFYYERGNISSKMLNRMQSRDNSPNISYSKDFHGTSFLH